jgi:rsbT co-antagonist protein RsbR
VQNSPDATAAASLDGTQQDVNTAYREISGHDDALIGTQLGELPGEATRAQADESPREHGVWVGHGAAEREALQGQRIEALRELSTPLIPISSNVVLLPLVGTIDTQRAEQEMQTLLYGIEQHCAAITILDVTGVRVIDTQTADALLRAAKAARLLGAEVVLTGIQPNVARTLVELEIDPQGITTLGTRQAGITHAIRRRRGTVSGTPAPTRA